MSPEQENNLFEDVGEIKESIQSLNKLLELHTTQDMTQFSVMTEAVTSIDKKVDQLVKDLAVSDAIRSTNEKHVSTIANRRAGIVGSIAGFIASALLAWIQFHFFGGVK